MHNPSYLSICGSLSFIPMKLYVGVFSAKIHLVNTYFIGTCATFSYTITTKQCRHKIPLNSNNKHVQEISRLSRLKHTSKFMCLVLSLQKDSSTTLNRQLCSSTNTLWATQFIFNLNFYLHFTEFGMCVLHLELSFYARLRRARSNGVQRSKVWFTF